MGGHCHWLYLTILGAAEKGVRRKGALTHWKDDGALQEILWLDVNLLWFRNTHSVSCLYIKNNLVSEIFQMETKQTTTTWIFL